MDGLKNGFDICCETEADLSRDNVRNLPTTVEQKLRVTEWIVDKREKGALWGPWRDISEMPDCLDGLRVSPLGTVKKGVHLGKDWTTREWRVIHHLSHPKGGVSVNSSIDDEFKLVSYVKFRMVVFMIWLLGPGALLWTIDAKDAYLRVPIKQKCYKFMGCKWCGLYYVFTCLSFGLASACRIYTEFADWVLWIVINNTNRDWWFIDGNPVVYHYIDDFFGGRPKSEGWLAWKQFNAVFGWFIKLGIPTQKRKCKTPRTSLVILGFLYDTVKQMVFIPDVKMRVILGELDAVLARSSVTQLTLLSLIGKLRWASVCLYAGPAFVRRMERSAYSVHRLHHFVKVSKFREDLVWWRVQILRGNQGIQFVDILRELDKGDVHVLTDASTGIGMGGWNRSGQWFRFRWTDHSNRVLFRNPKFPDIYWKEMCAIATSCLIWGHQWKGKSITFWCDNEACVLSMAKRKCRFEREDVMCLIRIIAECANSQGFHPYFIHIRGKDNKTADALSRFDLEKFKDDIDGIVMDSVESPCLKALDFVLFKCF
ncbi:MAG: hypothetical protein GY818_11175 [Planctomycetaceae bacterium]|nr:hypothetical protein [Planctomycetaceae bacterium]